MGGVNLKRTIVLSLAVIFFLLPIFKLGADSEENYSEKNRKDLNLIISEFKELAKTVAEFDEEVFWKRQAALKRSKDVRGVYLTSFMAVSSDSVAKALRERIIKLLKETELNGIVIDVEEASGPSLSEDLRGLIDQLHRDEIWVIARIAIMRDYSQADEHPQWYLNQEDGSLWRDEAGYRWFDPACEGVQNYILDISKQAIDFGFDELQFDYLRFPDRGDLENIVYPCFGGGEKSETINNFYLKLSQELRAYKKDIILSIDLFGQVAQYFNILQTGQNLSDAIGKFDYLSFMLYPSHYFKGFSVSADYSRGLPFLYFPYEDQELEKVVSNHPYEVVFRSLLQASDYLSLIDPKIQEIMTPAADYSFFEFMNYFCDQYVLFLKSQDKTISRIRPWLQNFDLKLDTDRGIYYDAEKVRVQIEAAEKGGSSGWLLWNPSNVYTPEALERSITNE